MIFDKIKDLKARGIKIGITFSTFDMLHAGHVAMLAEAKNHCDYLICGLQTDPTIDRPDTKNKPVQSIVERQIQLASCRYVDEVVVYQTEQDLVDKGKEFSGDAACALKGIELVFNSRDHSFSSSSLRKRVAEAQDQKQKW